jgi:5-hydroxyisourate hydrolase
MGKITTHVLDLARGKPAQHLEIVLERLDETGAVVSRLGHGRTDADGRLKTLLADAHALEPGAYKLTFAVGAYYRHHQVETFYDLIPIQFVVTRGDEHHHVPLLVSPHGYSTYRGS